MFPDIIFASCHDGMFDCDNQLPVGSSYAHAKAEWCKNVKKQVACQCVFSHVVLILLQIILGEKRAATFEKACLGTESFRNL